MSDTSVSTVVAWSAVDRGGRRAVADSRAAAGSAGAVRRDRRALQVRIDRQRAGRLVAPTRRRRAAAVLGVHGIAVGLQRPAAGRLRVARVHHGAGSRSPGGGVAPAAARRRSRRAELRRVSHRHASRFADRHAAHRAGHAGASDRPAAVRRVRPRLHARQPADRRQRSRTFSRRRRTGRVRTRAVPLRARRPAEDRDARATQPHRADSGRRSATVGQGSRRHVQSLQGGPVQLVARSPAALRAHRRVGLSFAVEPEAARWAAIALGRRQRLG